MAGSAKSANHLITQPVSKLLRQIAVPATVGFFFNTMYNVVDTYYGGLISAQAVAALSITFPVFFVIQACASGIATGATALIANAYGRKNHNRAQLYLYQAISFAVIFAILLTILSYLASPWLFELLGAQDQYLQMAIQYMNIISFGIVISLLNYTLYSALRAQGDTKIFRDIFIFSFFLNLILNPWFMFGGLGLPSFGLKGVAMATVLIQFINLIILIIIINKRKFFTSFSIKHFKPKKIFFLELSRQGLPAGVNMLTIASGMFVITYFVSSFGQQAVAAYGIATKVDQLAMMPMIGIYHATLILIGQNNGAKKFIRVKKIIKLALKSGLILSILSGIVILIFRQSIISLFTQNQQVILIGAGYLQISAFIYPAYVILYILTSALQGLKRPYFAANIGMFRQVIAPLMVFYCLLNYFQANLKAIWWGILAITWLAALIAVVYTGKYLVRLFAQTVKKRE
ncbi:MAG: MATE family efflux transporter [Candidatus Moranbacteria bacterium]|nr:MATE family efflux transporter [Candidatus Moranbacteria bacterium]